MERLNRSGDGQRLVAPLYARMLSLKFDGKPLGDHECETDKERAKRLYEKESLAYALVGCGVASEIVKIRSLEPSNRKPTADFEAVLGSGSYVRIELARLVDPGEKIYLNVLGAIVQQARELLAAEVDLDGTTGGGEFVVRFYGQKPSPQDIRNAGAELAAFILTEVTSKSPSVTLWPADLRWPVLHRLGAHVAHLNTEGPTFLSADAMRMEANSKATLDQFGVMFEQKKANFTAYSQGKPVWLVFYSDTRLFFPLGLVERLAAIDTFDMRPFDGVMLGCFTAGVVFEAPFQKPRYCSLGVLR